LADELEDVAFAFAVDEDDEDEDADDGPVLADETAVLWVGVPAAALVLVVEVGFDDPPHAVSSSTSEPSPAATVQPLLRITSLSLPRTRCPGPLGLPGS
jgi:hypothetical protein